MQQFRVNNNNIKLTDYLLQNLPLVSFATLQKALRNKDIKVNNVRVNSNITLSAGDEVQVYGIKPPSVNIVYNDDNIIIASKPSGIEVVAQDKPSLAEYIIGQIGEQVYAVHRLDRNTSGLVMLAKNLQAKTQLERCIKSKLITKNYYAVVVGKPSKSTGTITLYLSKDAAASFVKVSDVPRAGYVKAISQYSLVSTNEILSLLDINLITGRTHQIRASFAHIGLPVLGDNKYGNSSINKQYKVNRQCLVAYKLLLGGFNGNLSYLNGKEFILPADKLKSFIN